MAKLKNFIYCLNVNAENGRTDVIGVLNAMTPEYIPGLYSFSINFALLGIDEGEHLLVVKFKDPDNNVIAGIDNETILYKKDEKSNLPNEEMGISVAAGLQNVNFKTSGIYTTEVILDGTLMGEYQIFAKGKNE